MTNPLSAVSLAQLNQAVALKEQIVALESQLADILGGPAEAPTTTSPAILPPRRGRLPGSKMSPEARARIAAAQKARWAKFHAERGEAKPKTKTGGMSRAERGRLGALARWAKIRKEKGMKR
jgi:hypothetical protein